MEKSFSTVTTRGRVTSRHKQPFSVILNKTSTALQWIWVISGACVLVSAADGSAPCGDGITRTHPPRLCPSCLASELWAHCPLASHDHESALGLHARIARRQAKRPQQAAIATFSGSLWQATRDPTDHHTWIEGALKQVDVLRKISWRSFLSFRPPAPPPQHLRRCCIFDGINDQGRGRRCS